MFGFRVSGPWLPQVQSWLFPEDISDQASSFKAGGSPWHPGNDCGWPPSSGQSLRDGRGSSEPEPSSGGLRRSDRHARGHCPPSLVSVLFFLHFGRGSPLHEAMKRQTLNATHSTVAAIPICWKWQNSHNNGGATWAGVVTEGEEEEEEDLLLCQW